MNITQKILSDVTVHMKYARHQHELSRRETWEEIVDRNKNMHLIKFPHLAEEIENVYKMVYDKKVLPSMRSLQFAGKPAEINNARMFNCSFLPVDDFRSFSETMFLLLSGCGVGFSVQHHHVDKLPEIKIPTREKRYLINDSIEGWADAVHMLMKAYLKGGARPRFDFRDIRQKGAQLITAGGKAPGPEPLKEVLFQVQMILDRKTAGSKLTPVECHDILCHLADAVLSGGIRRAALISLFDFDDEDMLTCKFGNWWETNPQRGRANNSAVILRHKITKEEFMGLWAKVEASNAGEPGFLFSNDKDFGTNPCAEIALRPYQFCNLCEINAIDVVDQDDFNTRAKAAAFIGTLQASYTDFHYLRDIWKKTTERDALLGLGITGIASGTLDTINLKEGAKLAKEENARVADLLGINKAARTTTVKPSGTSSLVLGCSSGIHAWHDQHYIRRIRVGKNESIYTYLSLYHPELLEDDIFKPQQQAIISVPQAAPEGAKTRSESTLDLLERVKRFNVEWVRPGHRKGENYNNVSCTINIKAGEWNEVGEWMWENRNSYSAMSCLPEDLGSYKQAPYETITEEQFIEMSKNLHNVDLKNVVEISDETNLVDQAACAGNNCEIV
jgi:ribonucleoside-triphosphate reductase (thioredoxin)